MIRKTKQNRSQTKSQKHLLLNESQHQRKKAQSHQNRISQPNHLSESLLSLKDTAQISISLLSQNQNLLLPILKSTISRLLQFQIRSEAIQSKLNLFNILQFQYSKAAFLLSQHLIREERQTEIIPPSTLSFQLADQGELQEDLHLNLSSQITS